MTSAAVPIAIERLSHGFGSGELRRQVLSDVSVEIREGEIVILTGPSGSGKTTLLTLMGALRSAQTGSLRVLGRELRGARERTLVEVRRGIGYILQSHNLLDSLTARQNVQMALDLHPEIESSEADRRVVEALRQVGLEDRIDALPSRLSGGQRQRVAIARALVGWPRIVLADEPTASLDRETGRAVAELIRSLAREQGVTVVLVTHDHRILDVGDRILALEDGHLSSAVAAVAASTQGLLALLARDARSGELGRRIASLGPASFEDLLRQVTAETEGLLGVVEVAQGETFQNLEREVLKAFEAKLAALLGADAAVVLLLDEARTAFSTLGGSFGVAGSAPASRGIAGRVAREGRPVNVEVAEEDPDFDAAIDGLAGDAGSSLLGAPIADAAGRIFAVAEVARDARRRFAAGDEERLGRLARSLGTILEAWWRMGCACRAAGSARACACREEPAPTPAGEAGP